MRKRVCVATSMLCTRSAEPLWKSHARTKAPRSKRGACAHRQHPWRLATKDIWDQISLLWHLTLLRLRASSLLTRQLCTDREKKRAQSQGSAFGATLSCLLPSARVSCSMRRLRTQNRPSERAHHFISRVRYPFPHSAITHINLRVHQF
jgi:hypothetical protein